VNAIVVRPGDRDLILKDDPQIVPLALQISHSGDDTAPPSWELHHP
jgi:hypothetical protein